MTIDPHDRDSLATLYQEVIDSITLEDLEAVAEKHDGGYADRIQENLMNMLTIMQTQGLTAREFGLLVILNGISVLAVEKYRDSSQN